MKMMTLGTNVNRIQGVQDRLLRAYYSPDVKKLIVFLTRGYDVVGGGILSICSLYEESKRMKNIHGAEVIICTLPGDPPLLKYTKFKNQIWLFDFFQVMKYFSNLESLMIHIPEVAVDQFVTNISTIVGLFKHVETVHFNIMLQNIRLFRPTAIKCIERLKRIGTVTCTTAHERYSTIEVREKLGIPLHWLGTYVSPEWYVRTDYQKKENLLLVSPDPHPDKGRILRTIRERVPEVEIFIVMGIPYEKYKGLLFLAKWSLTFGEGLDGYFVEAVFSGAIAFAVYNTEFFTEDFRSLQTIYDTYEMLAQNISSDIKKLDNESHFSIYQKQQYELCCKHYNYQRYVENLKQFYKGQYTYE